MAARETLEQRWQRMSQIEEQLHQDGVFMIAGVDEAGRGPLAGPVAVAAVILPPDARILGLNDSKKLSEKQRLALEPVIKEQAVAWNVTMIDHRVIDKINILQATKLGMRQAVKALDPAAAYLLVDGMELDGVDLPQQGLIKGDARSVSIAAASARNLIFLILQNTSGDVMNDRRTVPYPDSLYSGLTKMSRAERYVFGSNDDYGNHLSECPRFVKSAYCRRPEIGAICSELTTNRRPLTVSSGFRAVFSKIFCKSCTIRSRSPARGCGRLR